MEDIRKLRSGMKMPDEKVSHEQYLSSHFFNKHAANLNERARSRKKKTHKTIAQITNQVDLREQDA